MALRSCLPVQAHTLPVDGDEDWLEPPLSANEYLSRVRREAEKIPDLLIAEHASGGNLSQTRTTEIRDDELLALEEADPTWRSSTLQHFTQLRRSLGRIQSHDSRIPVPPLRATTAWHQFCFGSLPPTSDIATRVGEEGEQDADDLGELSVDQGETRSLMDCQDETLSDCPQDSQRGGLETGRSIADERCKTVENFEAIAEAVAAAQAIDWSNQGRGFSPSLTLLTQLDLVATHRLLSHHVVWFDSLLQLLGVGSHEQPVDLLLTSRCCWTYALLANLPEPLHRDTLAEIRHLFCALSSLYAALSAKENRSTQTRMDSGRGSLWTKSDRAALAVVLVVAGRYFHQGPPERL